MAPLLTKAQRIPNPLEYETFGELINAIIDFIFWVAIVIAPIVIIIAAFYFLTSAGDPEKVRTAKRIILFAFIGLIIILSGRGIVALVMQILEGGPPPPSPTAACGNNTREGTEVCDDGNNVDCNGCKGDCSRLDNVCGDNIAECGEACDETDDAACPDQCRVDCTCPPPPSPCNNNGICEDEIGKLRQLS